MLKSKKLQKFQGPHELKRIRAIN